MVTFKRKKNINIMKVVGRIAAIILGLYIGGYFIIILGDVMLCTYSPMYKGLQLIGWTVTDSVTVNATVTDPCNTTTYTSLTAGTYNGMITATSNSGILGVLGLIGLAGVILQFIDVQF